MRRSQTALPNGYASGETENSQNGAKLPGHIPNGFLPNLALRKTLADETPCPHPDLAVERYRRIGKEVPTEIAAADSAPELRIIAE